MRAMRMRRMGVPVAAGGANGGAVTGAAEVFFMAPMMSAGPQGSISPADKLSQI